jgi:hypothetical protein
MPEEESSPPSSPPPSPPMRSKSPRTRCDCAVLARLETVKGALDWQVDELVRVPAAAHGYVDSQSGKQVGSFMTYVINFCVQNYPF